jgi:hypothetical protein
MSCVCVRNKINALDPVLYEFEYLKKIKTVIENHWPSILSYKRELLTNKVSDICNTGYIPLNICENSIFLLLFFDGASFTISSLAGNIWAVLAMITNLPPHLRIKFENIIKILFVNANKLFSFNAIFKHHLTDFKFNSIHSNASDSYITPLNMKVKVYIHAMISDSPARERFTIAFNTMGISAAYFVLMKEFQ